MIQASVKVTFLVALSAGARADMLPFTSHNSKASLCEIVPKAPKTPINGKEFGTSMSFDVCFSRCLQKAACGIVGESVCINSGKRYPGVHQRRSFP
jgi:hypothetical protein